MSRADTGSAGRRPRAWAIFLTLALIVLGTDLLVKRWAFDHVAGTPVDVSAGDRIVIPDHPPRTVVPKVLSLKLTLNRGAAFGLGHGARWLFVAVALAASIIVLAVFYRSEPGAWAMHAALALLLAGALGNLYDRVVIGSVRDMFWMLPGVKLPFGWRWPGGSDEIYPWIFNVADAAMCVALGLLLVLMYRADRRSPSRESLES